jgi:hypothetical protein
MSDSESTRQLARALAGADLLARLQARRLPGAPGTRRRPDPAWPQRGALDEAAGVLGRDEGREEVDAELAWR